MKEKETTKVFYNTAIPSDWEVMELGKIFDFKNGINAGRESYGKDAMDWSKEKANQEKSELIPHGKDGKIHNPNSYGNDPNPPKDKKK